MRRANWTQLVAASLLLSTSAWADDERAQAADNEPTPSEVRSVDEIIDELEATSRWRLTTTFESTSPSGDWSFPFSDFEFRNESAFERALRLRRLSFLTLGEIGETQLFLGVNEDGLLGLHFNAYPSADDEAFLEMARMPYLRGEGEDGDAE